MNDAIDVVGMIVIVGGILVLVRPGSQGPAFVRAVGNAFTGAMTVATGSGIPQGWTGSAQFKQAA